MSTVQPEFPRCTVKPRLRLMLPTTQPNSEQLKGPRTLDSDPRTHRLLRKQVQESIIKLSLEKFKKNKTLRLPLLKTEAAEHGYAHKESLTSREANYTDNRHAPKENCAFANKTKHRSLKVSQHHTQMLLRYKLVNRTVTSNQFLDLGTVSRAPTMDLRQQGVSIAPSLVALRNDEQNETLRHRNHPTLTRQYSRESIRYPEHALKGSLRNFNDFYAKAPRISLNKPYTERSSRASQLLNKMTSASRISMTKEGNGSFPLHKNSQDSKDVATMMNCDDAKAIFSPSRRSAKSIDSFDKEIFVNQNQLYRKLSAKEDFIASKGSSHVKTKFVEYVGKNLNFLNYFSTLDKAMSKFSRASKRGRSLMHKSVINASSVSEKMSNPEIPQKEQDSSPNPAEPLPFTESLVIANRLDFGALFVEEKGCPFLKARLYPAPLRPIYEYELGNKNAYKSYWMDKIIRLSSEYDLKTVAHFGFYPLQREPDKSQTGDNRLDMALSLFNRIQLDINQEHKATQHAEC